MKNHVPLATGRNNTEVLTWVATWRVTEAATKLASTSIALDVTMAALVHRRGFAADAVRDARFEFTSSL